MPDRILNVPYRSHFDSGAALSRSDCGPACLSMILGVPGRVVSPRDIAEQAGVSGSGMTPRDLVDAGRALGLDMTTRLNQTIASLKQWIDRGQPPIAAIEYGSIPDRWDQQYTGSYYVVVVGYDETRGRIFIHDPGYPPGPLGYQRAYAAEVFQAAWARSAAADPWHSCLIVPKLAVPAPGASLSPPDTVSTGDADMWILPAEGINLLDQPDYRARVIGYVIAGQHVVLLATRREPRPAGGGPSPASLWLQVRTDPGAVGWLAAARSGGELAVGRVAPPAPRLVEVRDTRPVRDVGGLSVRPECDVNTNPIERIPIGEYATYYHATTTVSGTRWLSVRSPARHYGWVRENISQLALVAQVDVAQRAAADRSSAATLPATDESVTDRTVWVIAPAGLVLRSQPSILGQRRESVPFGHRLYALGLEAAPDATGRVWRSVRAESGQAGFVVAEHGGERYLSDRQPPAPFGVEVNDSPLAQDGGGLAVYELRDVSSPVIERVRVGERLTAFGRVAGANRDVWLWIQSPRGQYGWLRERSNGQQLVSRSGNGSTPSPREPVVAVDLRPFGRCLTGVGMGEPQLPTRRQIDLIGKSKVEAFKLLTLPNPAQVTLLVNEVKSLPSIQLIIARQFFSVDAVHQTPFSADDFVDTVRVGTRAAYDCGVRYFEVHNEPNLESEGLGWNWRNGSEFGEWLARAMMLLREEFPDIQLGFPGLSPQPNVQAFLDGAAAAVAQCDWIGAHSYWQSVSGGIYPITAPDAGMHWRLYRSRYPNQLVMITEFSNNHPDVPLADKARQYGLYFKMLRNEPNLGGAFCFALSWPGQDVRGEAWESEGRETPIAGMLGSLLAEPDFLG